MTYPRGIHPSRSFRRGSHGAPLAPNGQPLAQNEDMQKALQVHDRRMAQRLRGRVPAGQLQAAAVDTHQVVVPMSTAIELGTPQVSMARWFGQIVMPELPRQTWKVQVPSWGDEHLDVYETERGWGADRERADFVLATVEYEMERHGLENGVDVDLLTIVDAGFRLQFRAVNFSRNGVDLSLERRKAILLGETTNYAASHTVDLTGSEWNAAGGDSKSDIEAGITQLESANPGFHRRHMRLALTEDAWAAAQEDPTWLAIRANFTDIHPDPVEAYRQYLGVLSVDVGDANVRNAAGTVVSMWGQIAILWIDPTVVGELDDEWGTAVFSRLHVGQQQVFGPYFENRNTTQWWPYDRRMLPILHNNDAAYLMHDMRS